MTNYKTSLTFFVFVGSFIYSVYVKDYEMVKEIGFICLIMWIILKTSSENLNKIIQIVAEGIRERWKR